MENRVRRVNVRRRYAMFVGRYTKLRRVSVSRRLKYAFYHKQYHFHMKDLRFTRGVSKLSFGVFSLQLRDGRCATTC
jgi:hypothetical protein